MVEKLNASPPLTAPVTAAKEAGSSRKCPALVWVEDRCHHLVQLVQHVQLREAGVACYSDDICSALSQLHCGTSSSRLLFVGQQAHEQDFQPNFQRNSQRNFPGAHSFHLFNTCFIVFPMFLFLLWGDLLWGDVCPNIVAAICLIVVAAESWVRHVVCGLLHLMMSVDFVVCMMTSIAKITSIFLVALTTSLVVVSNDDILSCPPPQEKSRTIKIMMTGKQHELKSSNYHLIHFCSTHLTMLQIPLVHL